MRALKALTAVAALTALLVGVPVLLLAVGNVGHLLTADWVTALWVGADSRVILALLSLLAWLAWAVLTLTVVFEVIAVLSRQRLVLRLPGTGWLRPAVSTLVAAAFALPSLASATTAAASPSPPPVATPVAPSEAAREATDSRSAARSYEVQPGDELWSVAERELGAGSRWREVLVLNPGLSETSRLEPGQILMLPEPPPEPEVVVVEPGDSLWAIAERELGDPRRWPELHELNRDQVSDPDQIDIGWELRVPAEQMASEIQDLPLLTADDAPSAPPETPAVDVAPPAGDAPKGRGDLPSPEAQPPETATTLAPQAGVDDRGEAESGDAEAGQETDDGAPTPLVGAIGAVLAGAVVTGLLARRRAQLLARAVGRRLIPVSPEVGRFWTALGQRAVDPPADTLAPTTVVLGWEGDQPVNHELEAARATYVLGEAGPVLAAAITGLACASWSEPTSVVIAGDNDWADAFDEPRLESADTPGALARLTRMCSARRLSMQGRSLAELRADSDTADAWQPVVFVFAEPLRAADLDVIDDALSLGAVGVSVLGASTGQPHTQAAVLTLQGDTADLDGRSFEPQLVEQPARRALLDLFAATGTVDTEPAPWWRTDDDLPANVTPLTRPETERAEGLAMPPASPDHPTLLLMGEVELTAAAGTMPSRSVGQCLEYCAWLLAHPGSRATAMMRDLLVADTTRRSNMSRLRTWLGADADGLPYLPDAYTGRISLNDRVTSDWEQFEGLLSGGVNLASTANLRRALQLVRGEPLGSFSFQWLWAQQLRADMVAMIVDAACVLADRSLSQRDPDTALWAVQRGRLAAADDALAVREIQALAMAGRLPEAERAVLALNRATRAGGRDLAPEDARRVQEALRAAQVG